MIDFLNEIGWIKQDSSGAYRITKKGESNTITRNKQTINFHM